MMAKQFYKADSADLDAAAQCIKEQVAKATTVTLSVTVDSLLQKANGEIRGYLEENLNRRDAFRTTLDYRMACYEFIKALDDKHGGLIEAHKAPASLVLETFNRRLVKYLSGEEVNLTIRGGLLAPKQITHAPVAEPELAPAPVPETTSDPASFGDYLV